MLRDVTTEMARQLHNPRWSINVGNGIVPF